MHITRKKKRKIVVISTIIIIISIPLVIWGLLNLESFDDRSRAGEEQELECKLKFLYVDPNRLEVNKPITVEVEGNTPAEEIVDISLEAEEWGGTEEQVKQIDVDFPQGNVGSTVRAEAYYTPENVGNYRISGTLTSRSGEGIDNQYLCLLEGGATAAAKIVPTNQAPYFTTSPAPNSINNLEVGDRYQYEVVAIDEDSNSTFDLSYSFTPRAPWLSDPVITKESYGDNGAKVTVRFDAIADESASYLSNIMIWDGYNGHTKSQSWIINVDPKENDIPRVNVSAPTSGTKITQGEAINIVWSADDQNQIVKYNLYYSKNPSSKQTWNVIKQGVNYKVGKFIWQGTDNVIPDDYFVVVEAYDNQSPAGVGNGVSGEFTVLEKEVIETPDELEEPGDEPEEPGDEPSDGPQIEQAQVISVSPADRSTVNKAKPTISARLVPTTDKEINRDTIVFKLNGESLKDKYSIEQVGDNQLHIEYTPQQELSDGSSNKAYISFFDSAENEGSKQWTFNVELEDQESSSDSWEIFGRKFDRKTVIIFGAIVIGIILIALLLPYLIYLLIQPKSGGDYNEDYYSDYTPPSSPDDSSNNSSYDTSIGSNTDTYYSPQETESDYSYTPPATISDQSVEKPEEPIDTSYANTDAIESTSDTYSTSSAGETISQDSSSDTAQTQEYTPPNSESFSGSSTQDEISNTNTYDTGDNTQDQEYSPPSSETSVDSQDSSQAEKLAEEYSPPGSGGVDSDKGQDDLSDSMDPDRAQAVIDMAKQLEEQEDINNYDSDDNSEDDTPQAPPTVIKNP